MEPVVWIVLVMHTMNVYFSSEESRFVFPVFNSEVCLLINFTDPGSFYISNIEICIKN